jgi:hypothetical protein
MKKSHEKQGLQYSINKKSLISGVNAMFIADITVTGIEFAMIESMIAFDYHLENISVDTP